MAPRHYARRPLAALLVLVALAFAGQGCVGDLSPAQAYFVAKSAYRDAQAQAARYVVLETADPEVKEAIKRVDRSAMAAIRKGDIALAAFDALPEDRESQLRIATAALRSQRVALAELLARVIE